MAQDNLYSDDSITVNSEMYLLIGTYTGGDSKGIYVYRFDTISGQSTYVSEIEIQNPSYLVATNDGGFVYSVTENGDATAAANAFSFNKLNGKLTYLNSQLTGGADPCYIAVDRLGKNVITANYSGGNITTFTTNEDGSLNVASQVISFKGKGLDPVRQGSPHLHCVAFSPDEKSLFAIDLGSDKIYKFDTHGKNGFLTMGKPNEFLLKPGSGPRHIDFHPNGKYAYVITELSGEVIAFNYDSGNLSEVQRVQADSLSAKGSADIHVHPDGTFLYVSNRLKGDGLMIYSIDKLTGMLTKVGYKLTGIHPRNFVITDNGRYLLVANRDSNIIQVFQIDKQSGLLEDIHADIKIDMPVCLKFITAD